MGRPNRKWNAYAVAQRYRREASQYKAAGDFEEAEYMEQQADRLELQEQYNKRNRYCIEE
jgi:hypothetical protein